MRQIDEKLFIFLPRESLSLCHYLKGLLLDVSFLSFFSLFFPSLGVETNVSIKREKKNGREAEKEIATVNRNYHGFRFVVVSRGFKGICLGPVRWKF